MWRERQGAHHRHPALRQARLCRSEFRWVGYSPTYPFRVQEFGREGGTWHALATPEGATNAVQLDKPLSQLEVACGLLTPLYVARCVLQCILTPRVAPICSARRCVAAARACVVLLLLQLPCTHARLRLVQSTLRSSLHLGLHCMPCTCLAHDCLPYICMPCTPLLAGACIIQLAADDPLL